VLAVEKNGIGLSVVIGLQLILYNGDTVNILPPTKKLYSLMETISDVKPKRVRLEPGERIVEINELRESNQASEGKIYGLTFVFARSLYCAP